MSKRRAVCSMNEEVFSDFETGMVRLRTIVYGPNYESGDKSDHALIHRGMNVKEIMTPGYLAMLRTDIIEKFESAGWRFPNVH